MSAPVGVDGRVVKLERFAARLESSGEYRVLRRLRLRSRGSPSKDVAIRRGVFVDAETTGLDPDTDEIVELAMLSFDYAVDGTYVSPAATFDRLRDPGRPISNEVAALTGITDEMVCGQSIAPVEVASFLEGAGLVIAHNSSFDRRFCERFFSRLRRQAVGLLATRSGLEGRGLR